MTVLDYVDLHPLWTCVWASFLWATVMALGPLVRVTNTTKCDCEPPRVTDPELH